MKLLFTDPEIAEVRLLRAAVAWEKCGITEIVTAYTEERAISEAEKLKPDLLLLSTDLSADGSSAFLDTFRKRFPLSEIVLIGNGTEGEAFRRYFQLGTADYLKRPVTAQKLYGALELLWKRVTREQAEAEERNLGHYWKTNENLVQEMFWKQLCLNRIQGGPQEIETEAARADVLLDKDSRYVIVLLTFANEEEMRSVWGEDLCQAAVQNLARILAKPQAGPSRVIVIYTRLVLIYDETELSGIEKNLQQLAERCRSELSAELLCYLGEPVYCEEIAGMYRTLLRYSKDDMLQQTVMNHVGRGKREEPEAPDLPADFADMLASRRPEQISRSVRDFLTPLAKQGKLSEKNIRIFQQDMLQLFFTYMEKKEMKAHELYDSPEIYRLYKIAILSIEGMCRWVYACAEYITRRGEEEALTHSARMVRSVKDYISGNLKNEVRLSQIAEITHLNPDYTTRVFKRETGMTIREYLLKKRMERARRLLQTTEASVSEVSLEVGYDNFSYFIRMFKARYGETPKQFRQRIAGKEHKNTNKSTEK